MRRFSLPALLAVALFCSCDQPAETKEATTTTATGSSRQEEMLKSYRELIQAIQTGDSATLVRLIPEDAIDHNAGPDGTDLRGKETIAMLTNLHNDIDNLKMEILEEAASDDHIFAKIRMTGTTNKPVWGMPANHKMDDSSIDLVKVEGNKMTDHWTYMTPADMMKMMAPPAGAERKSPASRK